MMFRRMRNRILLVNMTIITALLAILLSIIYLTTYNQIQTDNQAELDHISRWDFYTTASAAGEAVLSGDFRRTSPAHLPRMASPFYAGMFGTRVSSFTTVVPRNETISISSIGTAPSNTISVYGAVLARDEAAGVIAQAGPSMIRLAPIELSHSFHVIVDSDGEVIRINSYTGMSEEDCSEAAAAVWGRAQTSGTLQIAGHSLMYAMQPLNPRYLVYTQHDGAFYTQLQPTGHRMTFLDVTSSRNTLRELLTTELIAAAVGLIFIFAISYFFANRSIAPIARSWDRQKQFVADASHELKTPLAIISANSDALLASPDETVASQRVWVDYIKAETTRMSSLVNSLLALAQTEALTAAAHTCFDLSELVTNAALTMEVVAFEKGLTLNADLAPRLHISACREDITRSVLILLDNAVKYTNPGGTIAVTLRQEKRHAVLTVFNSGEGLSDDILPHIFDRFYRADPARNQPDGSFGLGLSIAKNIVEQSGGSICADSQPGAGVTLKIALPITEHRG